MNKTKTYVLIGALSALSAICTAETSTWSYNFSKTIKDGGEGFQALANSESNPDTIFTTINELTWSIYSEGTKKYGVITGGQTIGSSSKEATSHTSLYTYEIPGRIQSVRIKARRNKNSDGADLKISVNGVQYLSEGQESVALTTDSLLYEFKPATDAQEGKLDIELFQEVEKKSILYIKSIAVDYEPKASSVNAPKFSLEAGSYDEAQRLTLSVDDYEAGTYTIYYTTNGDSPRSPEGSRKAYTEPIEIAESMTITAATCKDNAYSPVVSAKYVLREDPRLSFSKDSVLLEAPDNGYSPYLNNPRQVAPITYKSSDSDVCVVSQNTGDLFTVAPGECTISAIFAGNENYKADTASYVLTVVKKVPLNKPVLSPMGGTFDGYVDVNVSVEDERAYTIWYSTTAQDSAELTDEPTIIQATSGKIRITKSCHLLVLAAGYNVFSPLVEADFVINEKAKAVFSADEASKTYYEQGFDSAEEIQDWNLYTTSSTTFRLEPEPSLAPHTSFSTIDPKNKYSLDIKYNSKEKQNETFVSPVMEVKENTTMEFYSFFRGGFLIYANWCVGIYDVEADKEEVLVDGFEWAQENGFTGPAWIRFQSNIEAYAGRNVQFFFNYSGCDGEEVAFDGFKLKATDNSEDAQIQINEGDSIHFHNLSVKADYIRWEFPGAIVENDTAQNPVVVYPEAGTYDVKLYIWNNEGEKDSLIRKNYVVVDMEMPKAIVGLPEEGYMSPFAGVFIPVNVPVTFRDLSTGNPRERMWYFQATDIENSTEQNPTVTYLKAGTYSVGLQVKNDVGSDVDVLQRAIQAGGAQYIWNIDLDERQNLVQISLGWYGNYAGTNWLMIDEFAEAFAAPLAPATIDSVAVYFATTETVSPDQPIVVTIREDSLGFPGKMLASGSVLAGDLNYDAKNVVETMFVLDQTASPSGKFYVGISGFPNQEGDNIAVLCAHRNAEGKNTVFHNMDTTETYEPSGIYSWYSNDSDPLSMAICPILSYGVPSGIEQVQEASNGSAQIFNLNGQKVNADKAVSGLYIVNGKKVIIK